MMENLSIADSGPRGHAPPQQQHQQQHQQQQPYQQQQQHQGGGPPQPAVPQQLPPQMFTTAAQLLDLTDKKLMVALRDGRKFIGVLRSWDQFANLVLQSTVERIFVPPPAGSAPGPGAVGLYADIPRGIFLVRGENVLLLGEIDLDKDDDPPAGYELADAERVQRLARERGEAEKARGKARIARLNAIGFEGEHMGDVLL